MSETTASETQTRMPDNSGLVTGYPRGGVVEVQQSRVYACQRRDNQIGARTQAPSILNSASDDGLVGSGCRAVVRGSRITFGRLGRACVLRRAARAWSGRGDIREGRTGGVTVVRVGRPTGRHEETGGENGRDFGSQIHHESPSFGNPTVPCRREPDVPCLGRL
jgi:hypothetical protein